MKRFSNLPIIRRHVSKVPDVTQDEKTSMIYSVVSTEEAKYLVKKVHEIDPKAFVNIIKTDYINGRFYQKTDY